MSNKLNLKPDDDLQQLTEKIAQAGGIQTDLSQFADPLQQVRMQGNFYRRLSQSRHFPWLAMFFSVIFFIFPIAVTPIYYLNTGTWNIPYFNHPVYILFSLFIFFIYFFIGTKIFLNALSQFFKPR